MSFGESIAPLLGRFVLGWFYLTQAYAYANSWHHTAALLIARHLPAPTLFLFAGILGLILGALSLIFGFRTRAGALILFTITVCATLTLHDYWHLSPAAAARAVEFDLFARNVAIAGGLLALVGLGGGRFVLDGEEPAGQSGHAYGFGGGPHGGHGHGKRSPQRHSYH